MFIKLNQLEKVSEKELQIRLFGNTNKQNFIAGIIKKLNLGLLQNSSFRVDLKNRNCVLSY